MKNLTISILSILALASMSHAQTLDRPGERAAVQFKEHDCTLSSMVCNTTVYGILGATDCRIQSGQYLDFWAFQGQAGDDVTITSLTPSFDPYMALLDNTKEDAETAASSGGPGEGTTITHTLGASGSWWIGIANSYLYDYGVYSISLSCTGDEVDPVPNAPSELTATTTSSTEVHLQWSDNSNDEDEFRVEQRATGGDFEDAGAVNVNAESASVSSLEADTEYEFRIFASNSTGDSDYSEIASATTFVEGGCQVTGSVLCLRSGRFMIDAGRSGLAGYLSGVIATGNDGSAVMYFSSATKWELIVNVQPRNGRFWFSASGLTEGREYDVNVTDVVTDESWVFTLPESNPRVTNAPLSSD